MRAAPIFMVQTKRPRQERLPFRATNARARSATDIGRFMAAALFRAWCTPPAPLHLSPSALAAITTRLLQTGAGGLVWWRVRQSELRDSPLISAFHQAYRLQLLQAELHKKRIQQVVTRLRSAGLDPLLGKGWAAAGYYESGLR